MMFTRALTVLEEIESFGNQNAEAMNEFFGDSMRDMVLSDKETVNGRLSRDYMKKFLSRCNLPPITCAVEDVKRDHILRSSTSPELQMLPILRKPVKESKTWKKKSKAEREALLAAATTVKARLRPRKNGKAVLR